MLESLGYAEAAGARGRRPDPVQHLLDPRDGRQPLRRAPRRRQARSSASAPRTRHRRRRLLGAVGQGRGLRALPVRRRRVRPRPGAQARRVPHERLAHRAGLLRVRGLHRPPARASARASSRAGCRSPSAATAAARYCIVPVHARARGRAPARRARRRGRAAGRRRRPRGHAAGAERQRLRPRPARARRAGHVLRRAARARSTRSTGIDRIRYTSPHPKDMREDVDPRARRAAERSASTSTCRCSAARPAS